MPDHQVQPPCSCWPWLLPRRAQGTNWKITLRNWRKLTRPKAAGIPRKLAPTIGISVDPRRQNLSEESLKANVERLQEYRKRLIVFPRRTGAKSAKKGDASAEEVKAVKSGENVKSVASTFPIVQEKGVTEGALSEYPATENAFRTLRVARSDARLVGVREKRAKAAAEAAAEKAK